MNHVKSPRKDPAFISLPQACRRIGIDIGTATRLAMSKDADFPDVFWLGGRRMLSRKRFEQWLDQKTRIED
jgi:hypothetical protein